ncbi:MAG TPA: tRNA (adenosine(37)-N6)-threonylcarbamoyltransferase complex ATPase subunit type 1 TsaE [Thermotogota bacterium]|nr:tRNA (adenosine(37)-N6)-threonylcarbamoyltransferase complex ATPase subunit type 1 TsaE [Thermotogota bacterium]HRW33950.1 tRNA (adenosine(37)-N6)-threonylcarbamoyltransferase complex ATPase subunit type 1 TsaE [Thermotogota bacterium]
MENSGEQIEKLGLKLLRKNERIDLETLNRIATDFARQLKGGQMVMFFGDLGSGKTTFIRAVMQAFGVEPAQVRSPTFNIVNTYQADGKVFYHIDVYRINSDELFDLGFYDYQQSNSILFIEWAEKIIHEVQSPDFLIDLAINEDNMETRDLKIYRAGSGEAC